MIQPIRTLAFCLLSTLLISCSDSNSISSGGGGSLTSDGGTESAQYSGVYNGQFKLLLTADNGDTNDVVSDAIITIDDTGALKLTAEGETVDGVINGDKVEVSLKIKRKIDGVTCTGTTLMNATIVGNTLSGPVTGSATCRLLLIKREFDISGTLSARKSGS